MTTSAPRHQSRTLKTCCTAHVVHDGLSDVSYVLLPMLAQTFGLSLAQVGVIRTAHRVAMAAFQLPAGLLAERVGERNLLALGTLISGLAFIGLGFANGYWMILIALFFAGMGSAVQHPLSSTVISHAYAGEGRRTALGTYNFSGDVGKFLFGGIVSLCVAAGMSWQAPVVGFGVAAMLTALIIVLWITNTHTPVRKEKTVVTGTKTNTKGWGVRNKPAFAALCTVDVVDSMTRTGFLTFIAFLLIAKGVPEGWAALSVPLVLQGTSSVVYGTVGDLVEEDKLPRAFALVYTMGSICGIIAPIGYGLLGDAIGIEKTMLIAGGLVLLALPLALVLRSAINNNAAHPSQS